MFRYGAIEVVDLVDDEHAFSFASKRCTNDFFAVASLVRGRGVDQVQAEVESSLDRRNASLERHVPVGRPWMCSSDTGRVVRQSVMSVAATGAEPTPTEDGDVALGGTLKELAQTLPWFVEKAFARVLGPIAGQRVADVGRRLLAFPEYAAERITESVARYARDEVQLVARGDELRRFTADTADIAARVDALASRVAALSDPPRPD